jgi:hypothetical protein
MWRRRSAALRRGFAPLTAALASKLQWYVRWEKSAGGHRQMSITRFYANHRDTHW